MLTPAAGIVFTPDPPAEGPGECARPDVLGPRAVVDASHVQQGWAAPLPRESDDPRPVIFEYADLASQITVAKSVVWKGRGELPQWPWESHVKGAVLLVDLWSGFGGAVMALLALGVRVFAVAAEVCEDCICVAKANLTNLIHVGAVEYFDAACLQGLLEKKTISAIIVGGGSPCQGNSVANKRRAGLGDARSQQPLHLKRIFDDLMAMPVVADRHIPVLAWLENVASAEENVKATYDEMLGASRLRINAANFGFVRRDRCFWGRSGDKRIKDISWRCPPGFSASGGAEEQLLAYLGPKPLPRSVPIEDGFMLPRDPAEVVKKPSLAMQTFTREYWHGWEESHRRQSPVAVQRQIKDSRRFAPRSYEDGSLVIKGASGWRVPNHRERLAMHGFPTGTLEPLKDGRSGAELEAARNSLVGNGFHLPSVSIFFVILFQLISPQEGAVARAAFFF